MSINKDTTIITFFGPTNDNGYLSNWYPSPLQLIFHEKLYSFQNVEQAMMASKAMLMGDIDSFDKILQQPDPKKVKKLGRNVKPFDFDLWDKHKIQIVKACVLAKFHQNPDLLARLLSTKDAYLAEASPYDKIWGTGSKSKNPKFWKGQNLLGLIIADVRKDLQNM